MEPENIAIVACAVVVPRPGGRGESALILSQQTGCMCSGGGGVCADTRLPIDDREPSLVLDDHVFSASCGDVMATEGQSEPGLEP